MSNFTRERFGLERAGGCNPSRTTCRYNVVKRTWAPGAWDKPPAATEVIARSLPLAEAKEFLKTCKDGQ